MKLTNSTIVGILVFALTVLPGRIIAQKLSINNVRMEAGKVILTYSISDSLAGRHYTVRLYSSNDNFLKALEKVDGDEGIDIRSGNDKTLQWDPAELGSDFVGDVALELKARPYVPFVQFQGFENEQTLKRAKPHTLTWSGGTPQNILNFELIRKQQKVAAFPNIANVGHYELVIPGYVKPGRYQLKVTDSKNRDEVVLTQEFSIKRKVPLALKLFPFLITGVAVNALLNQSEEAPYRIPDPIVPKK